MIISGIENRICEIRGDEVILDFDLAPLYDIETNVINDQVKRNAGRFPVDFMFWISLQHFIFFVQPSILPIR